MERTAPLNNAQKIKKPLLILQGKNDPRVPVSEAEAMFQAVKKNGVPVWYVMAKDEGHTFVKNSAFWQEGSFARGLFLSLFTTKKNL